MSGCDFLVKCGEKTAKISDEFWARTRDFAFEGHRLRLEFEMFGRVSRPRCRWEKRIFETPAKTGAQERSDWLWLPQSEKLIFRVVGRGQNRGWKLRFDEKPMAGRSNSGRKFVRPKRKTP